MPMTKSELARALADRSGLTKKQSEAMLEALAELAYAEAKNTFILPGIGKLSLKESVAREATMPFGPRKGEKYLVPAKKKIKFTLSKAARDAIARATGASAAGELEGKEDFGEEEAAAPEPAWEDSAEEAELEGDEDFGKP